MTRYDWLILKRLSGRVLVVLVIVFSLVTLVESTNWPLYLYLAEVGGEMHALAGLLATSGRWVIRTLTMTVLVGTTLGLLSLKAHNELAIMKASGVSVWRMMGLPLIVVALFGLVVSAFIEGAVTQVQRAVMPNQTNTTGSFVPDGTFWLEQTAPGYRYIITAAGVRPGSLTIDDAVFYLVGDGVDYDRIHAAEARYSANAWHVDAGVGFRVGAPARRVVDFSIPTTSTYSDLLFRMAPSQDLTFMELAGIIASGLSDPVVARAAVTRFLRYLSLPLLLAGAVLLAFSFATRHQRAARYGSALAYGVVIGFVLFFIAEISDQAGAAGTVDPLLAALTPPFAAVVIGLSVLLYREDGWT